MSLVHTKSTDISVDQSSSNKNHQSFPSAFTVAVIAPPLAQWFTQRFTLNDSPLRTGEFQMFDYCGSMEPPKVNFTFGWRGISFFQLDKFYTCERISDGNTQLCQSHCYQCNYILNVTLAFY